MAQTYRAQYLAINRRQEKALDELFAQLSDDIGAVLRRYTNADGVVPVAQLARVKEQALPLVTSTMLAPGEGGEQPFVVRAGRVIPRSPFMRILWRGITDVTELAVQQHAAIMQRALSGNPQALTAFQRGRVNPFDPTVREAVDTGILRRYDPAHLFVYDDGRPYTLSSRVWDTSADARKQLDAILTREIARGTGALEIAEMIEGFLRPGVSSLRTKRPYGRDASYAAMRLARTELTAAYHRSQQAAGAMNPFVTGFERRLSRSPDRACDECNDIAANGPYRVDQDDKYPPTHPHCRCYIVWTTDTTQEQVQQSVRDGDTRYITPLLTGLFTGLLLTAFSGEDAA